MTIEVIGIREFKIGLKDFEKKSISDLDKLLARMAINTQKVAVNFIQTGGRTGRLYTRRGIIHQASAPGEKPKTDRGNLVSNVTFEREGRLNYTVGSRRGASYGANLELGTSKMAKRPWLTPSYNQTLVKFKGEFRGR